MGRHRPDGLLRALPQNRWTWDHAAALGPEMEAEFWRGWIDDDDAAFAIEKLIAVGRARHGLHLARRERKTRLPSALLVQVLREAIRQPLDGVADGNEATMFQHNVVEILKQLDERDDVDKNQLAALEWAYLPVLTHSQRPAKMLGPCRSSRPCSST